MMFLLKGVNKRDRVWMGVLLVIMDGWMLFQLIAYVTNQTIAVLAVVCLQLRSIVIIWYR